MHRFHAGVNNRLLLAKDFAQLAATLSLTGAMIIGATSVVTAANNNEIGSGAISGRSISGNDAQVEIAQAGGGNPIPQPDTNNLDDDSDGIPDLEEGQIESISVISTDFSITQQDINAGTASGTLNAGGVTGTWSLTTATSTTSNTPITIEEIGESEGGGVYFVWQGPNCGKCWNLDPATFSASLVTDAPTKVISMVLHGNASLPTNTAVQPGPNFGSKFKQYTISWTGGDQNKTAIIGDPSNQLIDDDGSTLVNGGSFTQRGNRAKDNDKLQWNITFPPGATSFSIQATDGAVTEGFRFEATVADIVSRDTDDDSIPDYLDANTDGDGILDSDEGAGDRDGDGIPNFMDVDPAGYFYDETTGEIISGGLVSVNGPGTINLTDDGSATGFYQWFIDGTPGTYIMNITPPPGYGLSSTCVKQDPLPLDPTGGVNPTVIGNYEDGGNPGFLTSNNCTSFYLSFDLAAGDPFIINNNIPLTSISTPQNSSFCSIPYGMVYSGHFPNRIDAIHVDSGASSPLTTSNLASGTNSLASDHINKLVYYAENSAIYAWSPLTNTHITITNNIFSFAGTGNISSLSSGAAAFYGGSLYLGVDEASHSGGAEIYRVDFIPGSNGQTIQSITSLNIGSLLIPSDWGDISIDNSGVMLGVAPGSFWTYDLNNGAYTQLSSSLPGDQHQLAQDGQGRLWAVVYTPSKFIMQVEVVGSTLQQVGSTISVDPHDTNDGAECVIGESSIGDRIWTDLNGDDVQDAGESGIVNVTVDLYWDIDGDGQIDIGTDPILATDTTDANGSYHFPDLILGNYIVQVTDANGALTDTTLTSSTDTVAVTLPAGSIHFVEADVGYQPSATSPDVLLVKRITAINGNRTENPNDNTSLNTVVNDSVANSNDDHTNWPASYLLGELNAGLVKPGDEIEYTVYFLNAGNSPSEDVRICDWIQSNQSLVTGIYGGNDIELSIGGVTYQLTAANDAVDRAELTTVGSLPATPDCNISGSANASDNVLVLDVTGTTGDPTGLTAFPGTTGQGTPTNAFGFFRFTTKVDE